MSYRWQTSVTDSPVVVAGREARAGRARDRLGDETGDRLGALALDDLDHGFGIIPRHLREGQQQRFEADLAGRVAGNGDGAKRHPVVARMPADDLPTVGSALTELVVASQPQRRVGALAAAAGEEHLGEARRQPPLDEAVAQQQALLAGPDGHGVGAVDHRRPSRVGDLGAAPADVADDRPTGTVEDSSAIGRVQPAALAADDGRLLARVGDEVVSSVVHQFSLAPLFGQVVAEHDRQIEARQRRPSARSAANRAGTNRPSRTGRRDPIAKSVTGRHLADERGTDAAGRC